MSELWIPQGSFASGEIAPNVQGLVSTEQFRSGCQELTDALLSPTGSARKRFGTQDIVSTTSGYPAALFIYIHGGRRFVIQFVSQDDDPGDLNTTERQVRVLDAETRAFIDFGDSKVHGPFDAFGSAAGYYHHFTATQIAEVYAFQDGKRITFCHRDRPPLYMERFVVEGAETWKYGISASVRPPKVIDYAPPASLTWNPATGKLESEVPFFVPGDSTGVFRVMGAPADVSVHPIGIWVQAGQYNSQTSMDAVILSGVADPEGTNPLDWAGPYIASGSDLASTLDSSSTAENEVRTITFGTSFLKQNHVGTVIRADGDTFWMIETVASGTVCTARRISTGGGTVQASPTNVPIQICNLAPDSANNPGRRAWFRAFPVTPNALSGTVILTNPEPLIDGPADATGYNWLPEDHENHFDITGASIDVGGPVMLAEEVVRITDTNSPDSGGLTYDGQIVGALPHRGPYLRWALGWSEGVGFPRCGVSHQGRTIFGGFERAPQRIVGSRTADRDNFQAGDLEDDAISFDLTDPSGGTPTWMESAEDLLIGTTTGEGAIAGSPLTSSNLAWSRQTGYGGKNLRPALVGAAVLFASGRGLREMAFVDERQRYLSPDLTDLAKHLFEDESIAQIEYVSHPNQIVYVRLASGYLRALSYWRENGVVGWSPFANPAYPIETGTDEEDSEIESIAALRCSVPENDELWLVRRFKSGGASGAGSDVRRIERMTPSFLMDQTAVDASPTTTEADSGGLFVSLTGSYQPRVTLDAVDIGTLDSDGSGVVTYAAQASTPDEAQIGRSIDYALTPVIHDPGDRSGSLTGRITAVNALNILLVGSRGGFVGTRPLDPTLALRAGWYPQPGGAEAARPPVVRITHSLAYHFEVAALNMKVSYGQ